ncbi:MAG: polysaccharide deacetylase family protein [Candidatus Endonucleobacter sp. (ex Gigantidas childressi)]|nr:polysaccharide deacetylase family protein [Candidatus Endonucleobacter sp. (ex Gigantidas childressi)]
MVMLRKALFRVAIMYGTLLSSVLVHAGQSAVILQYHHISNTTPKNTSVSPKIFAEHLNYLQKNNFNILPLTKVTALLKQGMELPDKTVVITFDDAYKDIYSNAFPLIKQKGWPFTLFVSTEPVDRKFGDFLDWPQIQEMAQHRATIANHTTSHDHLVQRLKNEKTDAWLNRIKIDIITSEQRIKEKTGQSVKHFAWPFGETVPDLQKLIISLGYIGFGQQSGAANPLSDFSLLPRYPMAASYAKMTNFKLKVNSLPLPVIKQIPTSLLISKNNVKPKLEITLGKGDFQKKELRCYASNGGTMKVMWLDKQKTKFSVQTNKPLPIGRSRYNCTAPSVSGKQYYWHSHSWLRLNPNGKAVN